MKTTQNALPLLQMRRFRSSAWSDAAVTGAMLNRNGSSSHPQEKPPQAPKGTCHLIHSASSTLRQGGTVAAGHGKTQVSMYLSVCIMETPALLLLHSSTRGSSSSATNQALSFGNPCYNFTADRAERNTPSTWILKILCSANTASNSDKFLVFFQPSSSSPNCNYT